MAGKGGGALAELCVESPSLPQPLQDPPGLGWASKPETPAQRVGRPLAPSFGPGQAFCPANRLRVALFSPLPPVLTHPPAPSKSERDTSRWIWSPDSGWKDTHTRMKR